jgi:hypothetical protein
MASSDELYAAALNALSGARLTQEEIDMIKGAEMTEFMEAGLDMDMAAKAVNFAGIENNRHVNQDLYDPLPLEEGAVTGNRLQQIIREELEEFYGSPKQDLDYPQPEEGKMVKGQLYHIAQNALQLHEALDDDADLPGWCIQYVGQAAEKLSGVVEYLEYKILQQQLDGE